MTDNPLIKSVPDALTALGDLYRERNKLYGDNYKNIGKAYEAMFPKGVTLKTADDFNRFCCFVWTFGKVSRYAEQFDKGGHHDSLDDIAVYSQMLQELDSIIKANKV